MNKFLLVCVLFLGACATPPEIKVITKPVDLGPFNVPAAQSMALSNVSWTVVTKENFDDVIKKNPESGLFVLNADAYKHLAGNMIEIKRYIQDLQAIISYMNDYIIKTREVVAKNNSESK